MIALVAGAAGQSQYRPGNRFGASSGDSSTGHSSGAGAGIVLTNIISLGTGFVYLRSLL